MFSPLVIALFVCLAIVIVAGVVAFAIAQSRCDNHVSAPAEEVAEPEESVVEEVEEEIKEEVAVAQEVAVEEVKEEVKEEIAKAPVEEVVADDEDVEIGDVSDADIAKRIAFGTKLLTFGENIQGYFNTIYNKFISLRKINPRISTKGVSFRLGRDLIARLTIRGKTMRLHLALNVADYDTAIYFQKDMGDVKSYVEIPLMVKVRSDRGMKNAMKLIEALIEKKGIEAKVRYNEVDAVALLKDKLDD